MMKFIALACFLAVVSADAIIQPAIYSPYVAAAPLAYTRYAAPLAYAKFNPASGYSSYSSVATPNSYQQQYQENYKPSTYSAGYLYA